MTKNEKKTSLKFLSNCETRSQFENNSEKNENSVKNKPGDSKAKKIYDRLAF